MKPLQGSYYDNLFSHYRPVGDAEWYLREHIVNFENDNDVATDIGECSSGHEDDNLVKSGEDLFTYWRKVTPAGGFGDAFRL